MREINFNDTAFEFYSYKYSSHGKQEITSNSFYQIWYIKSGTVRFVNDKKTIIVSSGDTLYIPIEEEGTAYFSGEKGIVILKFSFRYFPGINNAEYSSQIVTTTPKIISLMNEIPFETIFSSLAVWKFYEYLDEIQKMLKATNLKQFKKIEKALEYMNSHDNYNVSTLAKLCNMSESGFYTAFKRIIGTTPIEEKHRRQVLKAEELLISTDLSVEEIAVKVGFQSAQYFRKIFKKHYGQTPLEIRKNS